MQTYQTIEGGVTAAKGFRAGGVHAGVRKNSQKLDFALIAASKPCAAAAVYTQNRSAASPIAVTREHLGNGVASAILVNSGNANCCAVDAEANANRCCAALAAALGIPEEDVIVNSTGVIGQRLPVEKLETAIPALTAALDAGPAGSKAAAKAIMTTDLLEKETAVRLTLGGKTVTVGAIAKGSGMIHPNMATMIALVTTDCAITAGLLHAALTESVDESYNCISVDGDTSTNDMTAILASGEAGNPVIDAKNADYEAFTAALTQVNLALAKLIAKDGEGATKLVTCHVTGAASKADARTLSKGVISSSLVKAAMFGADANWGRVLCAMGYSGADFVPEEVDVAFVSDAGAVAVCKGGRELAFDEAKAKEILSRPEVTIEVAVGAGAFSATAYGCDLTYDYVKINGDYRT